MDGGQPTPCVRARLISGPPIISRGAAHGERHVVYRLRRPPPGMAIIPPLLPRCDGLRQRLDELSGCHINVIVRDSRTRRPKSGRILSTIAIGSIHGTRGGGGSPRSL